MTLVLAYLVTVLALRLVAAFLGRKLAAAFTPRAIKTRALRREGRKLAAERKAAIARIRHAMR